MQSTALTTGIRKIPREKHYYDWPLTQASCGYLPEPKPTVGTIFASQTFSSEMRGMIC